MRILSLEVGFPPELASGRLPYEFSRELIRRGHKVTVVTVFPRRYLLNAEARTHSKRFFCWETMENIRVLRVQPQFAGTSLLARAAEYFLVPVSLFVGGLFAGGGDLLLCSSPPLLAAFAGSLLGKVKRVPVILRLQDIHPDSLIKLGLIKSSLVIGVLELIERFIYTSVSGITVISQGCLKLVTSKVTDRKKIELIPNWTDLEKIHLPEKSGEHETRSTPREKFVITYAGVMSWPQDLETVVDTANLLKDFHDIEFLFVGQGAQEKLLKEKVGKLGLKNVRFLPLQLRPIYFGILRDSDVCLVSLKKSYTSPTVPSKILDIMASSKPVIANVPDGSDTQAIVEQAQCGVWVEPGNAEYFKQAVLRLYSDKRLAREMGRNGREYVEKHLSLAACADKYEALLNRILLDQRA